MNLKRGQIVLILTLMSISICLLIYSFAFTSEVQSGVETNYLTISNISFGLSDTSGSINLGEQLPTIDKFGIENESFDFSITNNSKKEQKYTVRLVDVIPSTINNSDVRYQLTINEEVQNIRNLSVNGVIDSGVIGKGKSIKYSLKIWLSYEAEVVNGTWSKVVKVEAGTSNIDDSGANEPILADNMIPVYYDEVAEVWRKADATNMNINHYWYDYNNQRWANAVTVSKDKRDELLNSSLGKEISLDDVNSMWVWIPRFKYDLFEKTDEKNVSITFETGIDNTGDMKCVYEDGHEKCQGSKSYTHPAFKFGDEELSGFWVSKFELGLNQDISCNNDNCNSSDLEIVIKPNQTSLHHIELAKLFKNVRKMELKDNIYGFKNSGSILTDAGTIIADDNDFDIHPTKTFESAALSYLTYSKYGKYGNEDYQKEDRNVFANDVSNKTGASTYNRINYDYNVEYYGTGASTTGNVYGVYDLNGLVSEYLMANVSGMNGEFLEANSGFVKPVDNRYFDIYPYADLSVDAYSFYGDGFKEFGDNNSQLGNAEYPFIRKTSSTAVTFSKGGEDNNVGGRAVLVISHDVYITEW